MYHKVSKKTVCVLLSLIFSVLIFLPACKDIDSGDKDDGKGGGGNEIIGGEEIVNGLPYTIKFDTGVAGYKIESITAIEGSTVLAPRNPTNLGYKFGGWLLDEKPFTIGVMPSRDITLTAKWTKLAKTEILSAMPVMSITLREADGTPVPESDPRFGAKGSSAYINCDYEINIAGATTVIPGRIKPRGNGSYRANPVEKRPYRIKFDKKQSLFGWPKSKQYVFVSSSHSNYDGSRLVAHAAFGLGRDVFTNLEYSTRSQPVEVQINGAYRGIYLFAEKPRIEEGRLDIPSDHGVADTGYLLFYGNATHTTEGEDARARFDLKGTENGAQIGYPEIYNILVESPDVGDIDDPAETSVDAATWKRNYDYIRAETRSFTQLMNQVRNKTGGKTFADFERVVDIDSFVDSYILQELFRNGDVGAGGFYMFKKPGANGAYGKFCAGPPWDMDGANGINLNLNSANPGKGYEGFSVNLERGSGIPSRWNPYLAEMYRMPEFYARIVMRWKEIAPQIKTYLGEMFRGYMDDTGYEDAFMRGASNSNNGYRSANWKSETQNKLNWLLYRTDWLSAQWV